MSLRVKPDLASIIAAMPGHVYWKDQNGVYLGCNDQQAKKVGLSKGTDVIGKTDYDLCWREQADIIRKNDIQIMNSGQAQSLEESAQLADGTFITALTHKVPLRNEKNEVVGILGISLDITEKKHKQKELKQAKVRAEKAEQEAHRARVYLDNILAYSPANIYWKSLNGKYLGCNEAASKLIQQILGHPCQVIGKKDHNFFEKSIADKLVQYDQQVVNTGMPVTYEATLTLANGNKVTHLCNRTPLRDENNKIIGILGSSVDITEQKQKESDLLSAKQVAERDKKRTEIYLQSIISNLPDHVYWKDANGTVLGCNDQQAKSVGLKSADELIGRTFYEIKSLLHWDDEILENIRQNDLEVMRTGKTMSVEEEVVWADGVPRTFLSKKSPLKDEHGNSIGILGLSIDITERKAMENKLIEAKRMAEESNRAKSDFIANISHDLRTPLHTVLGSAELLKLKKHFDEQEEHINAIIQSGETLLSLVENILDFSAIEQSKLITDEQPVDLRALIADVVSTLNNLIQEKAISVITHYPQSVPHQIISDSEVLRRILTNLLSNAVKFTNEGKITITVETVQLDPLHATLKLTIKDTGVGIPASELNHIFERFYRFDPSYKGKYKGTGLGLAITKKLVEQLKGTINVKSDVGVGTEFNCLLNLKLNLQPTTRTAQRYDQLSKTINPAKQLSILLVEDIELIQKFSTNMLETLGCKVTIANNGKEANQLLKNNYDLIFMDIGLPDIDGLSLIQKIRQQEGDNKHTPIIALTAHATNKIKKECFDAGADHFLTKPASFNEILACINKYTN